MRDPQHLQEKARETDASLYQIEIKKEFLCHVLLRMGSPMGDLLA
jgi:hypothetical protein